ncbi:MAG: thioredoxin [Thermodesulfobacteriota bacterium]|nr:thioredoxin [Thermodesulfobacteriota bacterium]
MPEEKRLLHLTDDTFSEEILNSDEPAMVDFWAPWCGPCKAVGPIVEELAAEYFEKVKIAKINVDENQKTAAQYSVRSIPTLIMFKGGESVDQIVGLVSKAKLEEMIKKAME